MVDNGENILVEFDYQNISVIDPNKVVDQNGKASERLINQEDLVFYANLECSVLPRTKLAIGVPLNDTIRTISVGKINFLNPGEKNFLDTSYTDEITGQDTLQGKGINQQRIDKVINPNPIFISSEISDPEKEALKLFTKHGILLIPVIDKTRKIQKIISIRKIMSEKYES
jgi:hypothetical protein